MEEKKVSVDQKTQKKPGKQVVQLSEQDLELKTRLEQYVEEIIQNNTESLEKLKTEVRTATTSMTSVPKPFKFLKESYGRLVEFYNGLETSRFKKQLADFLSVLAMTYGGDRDSLLYLQEGTLEEFKFWGHEYLSHLAANIGSEFQIRLQKQEGADDLLFLVDEIIPYFMDHNSEHDAIDLLSEVDQLQKLEQYVNQVNIQRILVYLLSIVPFSSDQDELDILLVTAYNICLKVNEYTNALRIALRIDKPGKVEQVFEACQDPTIKKQLAFQLARHRYQIDEGIINDETLKKIAANQYLSQFYINLAKDLEVLEPKTPDQVYKAHLEEKNKEANFEQIQKNLAATYCNGFVNAGFKKDALMSNKDNPWLNSVKNDHTAIAAVASIGLINLWNIDNGTEQISEYFDLSDIYTKAGGCIGFGLFCSGIVDENQPAQAILLAQLESPEVQVKIGAVMGLGLAYAGSARVELQEQLISVLIETADSVELAAMAALSLGLIFVGKCNDEVANAILQAMMERPESQLDLSISRYFAVGLGLLYLGQAEAADIAIESLALITHKISKYAKVTLTSLAYASTGNVLKVQELLGYCSEVTSDDKGTKIDKNYELQQVAILGIALIASSEDIGSEMVYRIFQHILQFSDVEVKRAIPLAVALINISNPKIQPMDLLLKLAHDRDQELSYRATLSMGLLGAGTNNSRIADKLRGLAVYFMNDSNGLFLVRIAQGLLHMGKGLLTLQPYYSDKFLMNKVAIAGIISFLHGCLDIKNLILEKNHTLLYYLGIAMYPRMFFTLNDNLENLPVQVRVGQAVDAVGQAGKPKRITGFQTHTSPVIVSAGERAELGNDEYMPVQDMILENFVILKKNPDYKPEIEQPQRKKTSFSM
ncbi:unnamed protein product [Paramecium primaurelia]|uniref:26S proteasome non-ATPase regulatory subunit 2 homolog n=1 Tax=Paramecium primaurelia TaxID=5886 RepID=A0A8S1N2H7_PARPR|nr:unnamed protein product [Paramecium primaurelia]